MMTCKQNLNASFPMSSLLDLPEFAISNAAIKKLFIVIM